jgi:hypothetical protein
MAFSNSGVNFFAGEFTRKGLPSGCDQLAMEKGRAIKKGHDCPFSGS